MGWWLAAIVALEVAGLVVVYALLRGRLDRARSPAAGVDELRQEIGRIIVELNRVTDRSVALLEDKAASLNDLLAAADKRMSMLKREIERHELGSRLYDRLAGGRPAPVVRAPVPAPQPQPQPAAEPGPQERDPREEVLRLHRAGFSPQIIASRVGAPLGEVELIISLGGRYSSPPKGRERTG